MKWTLIKDDIALLTATASGSWYTDGDVVYQGDINLVRQLPGFEDAVVDETDPTMMYEQEFGSIVDTTFEDLAYTCQARIERDFDEFQYRNRPDVIWNTDAVVEPSKIIGEGG